MVGTGFSYTIILPTHIMIRKKKKKIEKKVKKKKLLILIIAVLYSTLRNTYET